MKSDLKVYESLKRLNLKFNFDKLLNEDDTFLGLLAFQLDCLIA